jgi:hypothetical protein
MLAVRIEGRDMPGRSCAPPGAHRRYDDVHVGVQRGRDVVDVVPGDASSASWELPVTVKVTPEGALDFAGPYVHGKRGDRFLYLVWVDGDSEMFRRAKLHFADCDDDVMDKAVQRGTLACRVNMTDRCGAPRCARVRPPDAVWS